MNEQPQMVETEIEKPENIADDIRAAMKEIEAPETESATDDRPRDEKGRFAPKDQPAVEAAPDKADTSPVASSTEQAAAPSASSVEPPQHWPQADKDWFKGLPSDDMRNQWLSKVKSLEDGYQPKFQEIAEIKRAIEPHGDYLRQLGVTPGQAFNVLIGAERTLRMGTPQQKQAALMQLAQDYGIPLSGGAPQSATQPAVAEGEWIDPSVQALLNKVVSPLRQRLEQFERAKQMEEQGRVVAEIQAFADAKDEAGKPKHPHFADVADDIALLAQAERAAGRVPQLNELYRKACRLNEGVSVKIEAEKSAELARKAQEEAKAKAAKAVRAGSSINGAPKSGTTNALPADTLEEEVRRNYHEAMGRA